MNQLASDLTSAFPILLLWAGAALVALVLLGKSMKLRRQSLTDSLKKHVGDTIGALDDPPPTDSNSKT